MVMVVADLENLLYLKIMKEGVVVVVDDFKKIFHI